MKKTLGEQVRAFREARGWNSKQMADAVGTSRQNIESLEQHGNRIPKYIGALATVMGRQLDDILKQAGLAPARSLQATAGEPETKFGVATAVQGEPDLVINQYEAGGAMGHGLVLDGVQPGIIRSWRVTNEWLRLNLPHASAAQNLCIVTGFGPSMKGLYNPGDPLVCDLGRKTVDADGVYFFRVEEHGYIKMLQRIPTADGLLIRAKSKNRDYDPFDITPAMLAREGYFEVFGKILTVWKSEVL